MFVTVEGVDYVGKSTLAKQLVAKLRHEGKEVVYTFEPGGTTLANDIRGLFLKTYDESISPYTELCLVTAARLQHVNNVIMPALNDNKYIICDRYTDSTIVYQSDRNPNEDHPVDEYINKLSDMFPIPELTLLLTCELDELTKRTNRRAFTKVNRYDRMITSQDKFQNTFLKLASNKHDLRWRVLDTTKLNVRDVVDWAMDCIKGDIG